MAGGNATFGKICVAGSSPCQIVTSSAASQVDYLAPGAIPSPNPFSIVATSASNSSLSSSTQVTVINHTAHAHEDRWQHGWLELHRAGGLCSLMGITKSIVCLWAAVIKSTPSRWAAPLRRRR